MKLVVILLIITLVNAVPQLHQQEYNSNHELNPLNDEEAQQEAKEQKKRTLQGPTYIGGTRHVGIHPLGFKYVLGYGPVGYYPYAKPVTVLKPVMHTHGWKPIIRVPVTKPVFKPIVPVKPVHEHPVIPVHHPEPVQPVHPIVPIQKPIVPVVPQTIVKPFVPLQPQLPYLYPFFKPLHFQPQVLQPHLHIQPPQHLHIQPPQHLHIQPPVVHQPHLHIQPPVVHQPHLHIQPQPLVPQHPVFTPQFPQFVPQFAHQFPLPGVANPIGPIENTNSIHTSYSATFPRHPIIGVHTPPPLPQPPLVAQHPLIHPIAQPPFVGPIQPHLLHVIRHFPHLFKHITPLYPVNNPAETPVAELPKPIVPPVTVHNPFSPQDNGASVQIPQHLPEHPNYRPEIPNFYPMPQPEFGHQPQPDFAHQPQPDFAHQPDNSFAHQPDNTFVHQPAPQPQTPLYLPPHPFLRQGGPSQPQDSVQTEFSATYPRNIHPPSISLEAPYRRSDVKT